MKLQEYLKEIAKDFHLRHGFEFGFTESQSEAHFDLTTQAAMQYIQGLAMSGKMGELQNMFSSGADAIKGSSYYQELMQKITDTYYGLDWTADKKQQLAETALAFALNGLKQRFEAGGYSNDLQGVLSFIGLDGGMLGLLGKFGGLFSKFRR
ncbi:MAG: hypothetical protein JNL57_13040 [Bacteroidetes bacterium]|nr:hypothetical protein [Bacteroidota bacterium]